MTLKLLPFFLIVSGSFGGCPLARAANDDPSSAADIQQLIAQLGDEQYVLRQRAETQLVERGAEVFAELKAAENHADLEIATRAKYLLSQIRIEWIRPTDPPVVRSIMARYGELSQAAPRLAIVGKLSRLEHEQGFGALCRIARFETSGPVARYAALAILEKSFLPSVRTAAAVRTLSKEIGESTEVPVSWVRLYMDQLQSPQAMDSRWLALLDAEITLLAEEKGKTSKSLVLLFLHCHLDLCGRLSDAEAIVASLGRRIEMEASSGMALSRRLLESLNWLTEHEQWGALELLEGRYADAIENQRLLLYLVAVARDKQGRAADAEDVADRAFHLKESRDPFAETDAQERNQCALFIADLGRHDWAEREWKSVVETLASTELQSLVARDSLGQYRLHDRLQHKAAADLLTETIDAIDADPAVKQRYRSDTNLWYRYQLLRSHREYFLATHFQALGDTEKQRRHLEQAYKLDPSNLSNADVLIAMYRLKDSDAAYRQQTQERIAKSLKSVETEIKKAKSDPQNYNHWAWLVSNTEGDFKKAVKYSQRSLALAPGSPGYLDTLGRCYYSAGDLENAVKVQREAVAKHPRMRVMQRQLKQFEDEMQEREDDAD